VLRVKSGARIVVAVDAMCRAISAEVDADALEPILEKAA
jgi:hypothetical protein